MVRIGIPGTKIGIGKPRGKTGEKEQAVFDAAQASFKKQVAHLLAIPTPITVSPPTNKKEQRLAEQKAEQERHTISIDFHPKIHERRQEPAVTNVLQILDVELSFHLRLYNIAKKLDENAREARRVKGELDQVSKGAKNKGELAKEQKKLQDAEKAIRAKFKTHLNELRRIERREQFSAPIDRLKNAVVEMLRLTHWSEKDKKKISDILSSMRVYEAEFLYTTVKGLANELKERGDDIVATVKVNDAVKKILQDFQALAALDKELRGVIEALEKEGGYRYYYMSGIQSLKEGTERLNQANLNEAVLREAFGRLAYAVEFFKEAIKQNGALPDAYFYLAQSYYNLAKCELKMNKRAEAIRHLELAIAATDEKETEKILVEIRNAQAGAEEKNSMLQEYRLAAQKMKEIRPSAFSLLGQYYSNLDDTGNAIKNFDIALKLNPKDEGAIEGRAGVWIKKVDELCQLGGEAERNNALKDAIDAYVEAHQLNLKINNLNITKHAEKVNENFFKIFLGIGQCQILLAIQKNEPKYCDAVIEKFRRAGNFNPENNTDKAAAVNDAIYKAYVSKGGINLAIGQFFAAISSFDLALGINANGNEALTGNFLAYTRLLVQEYDRDNKNPQSLEYFNRAMTYYPRLNIPLRSFRDYSIELARVYTYGSLILSTTTTEFADALDYANKAIVAYKDYALAYVARARALLGLKKNREAIIDFKRAEELNPAIYEDRKFSYERGLAYVSLGLEHYNSPRAIRGMGANDSTVLRELDEAIKNFKEARKLGVKPKNREDVIAHELKGGIYNERGEFRKALREMDELVKLGQASPEIHLLKGMEEYNEGIRTSDTSEKIKHFTNAIHSFSRMPDSLKKQHLKEIAEAYRRLGDSYNSYIGNRRKAVWCYLVAYKYFHAIIDSQGFADDEAVAGLGVVSYKISYQGYEHTGRRLNMQLYRQESIDIFRKIEKTEYYAKNESELRVVYAKACVDKALYDFDLNNLQESIIWCREAIRIDPTYRNAKTSLDMYIQEKEEQEKKAKNPPMP